MKPVQEQLKGVAPGLRHPLEPEIGPLVWLRRFSNFLTPRLGLMSADTWAFAGSYIRNLLLVWLMLVPVLAAVLALPRFGIALLRVQAPGFNANLTRDIAAALLLLGTAVVAFSRPVSYREKGRLTDGRFLKYVLLPYVAGALLLAIYWAGRWVRPPSWIDVQWGLAGLIGINVVSSLIYMVKYAIELRRQRPRMVRADSTATKYAWKKLGWEMLAAVAAGATGTGLLYAIGAKLFDDGEHRGDVDGADVAASPTGARACRRGDLSLLRVPVVLGMFFVQSAIFVGLSSWFNEEYDREWWGRAAGWVLLAALGWMAGTAIAVYGPVAIYLRAGHLRGDDRPSPAWSP